MHVTVTSYLAVWVEAAASSAETGRRLRRRVDARAGFAGMRQRLRLKEKTPLAEQKLSGGVSRGVGA